VLPFVIKQGTGNPGNLDVWIPYNTCFCTL